MIKKEFYKLIINPLFLVFTILLFFSVGVNIYYGVIKENDKINIVDQNKIYSYNSITDVANNLNKVNDEINKLSIDDANYENKIQDLKYKKVVYEFLLKNYIPYEELVDSSIIALNPQVSYYSYRTQILLIFAVLMVFYISIVNYCVLSQDFDNNSYRYIYAGKNRKKIFLSKFFVIYLTIFVMGLIICFLEILYSNIVFESYNLSLFVMINDKVMVFDTITYTILDTFFNIIFLSFLTALIFDIFLIFKKTVFSFLGVFVYILFVYFSRYFSSTIINSFFYSTTFSFLDGTLIYHFVFYIIVCLGLFCFGFYKNLKNDL